MIISGKTTTEETKETMFYFLQYAVYIYIFILVFLVRKSVIGEDTSLNYWEDLINLCILLKKAIHTSFISSV